MLQEPVVLTTAKLDISLLLKPTPSPSPSTPSSTPRETARGTHSEEYMLLARSSSVPALSVQQHALEGSHRGSTSSTISAAITSNIVPTAQASGFATVLPTGRDPMEVQAPSHHRPILPPLLTSNPSPYQRRPPQHYASQPRFSSPQQQPLVPINFNPPTKRPRPNSPPTQPAPAKRQSKWTPEEDAIIIELRGTGMKWDDISKRLPGRSAISCRLHYQNYLERRSEWDEEKKNRLARLYERLKPEMWAPLAAELGVPWRAAEAMHWQLGEADMARRAGVVPFSLASAQSLSTQPPPPAPAPPHAAAQFHPGPSSLGTLNAGYVEQLMSYQHMVEPGPPRARGSSAGSQGESENTPATPAVSLSGVASSAQSQSVLPSMAEFERGLTSSSDSGSNQPTRR